jgi:hypothetical protein
MVASNKGGFSAWSLHITVRRLRPLENFLRLISLQRSLTKPHRVLGEKLELSQTTQATKRTKGEDVKGFEGVVIEGEFRSVSGVLVEKVMSVTLKLPASLITSKHWLNLKRERLFCF